MMSWHNETYIIGEKAKVQNETELGVITSIDFENGLVYVLFKRMRESIYPYPQALDDGTIKPLVSPK